MNIYVQVNDQKQLTAYSSNSQAGYTLKTISMADSYSLPQYFNLMWAEEGEGGLIHADNLPLTDYEKSVNQSKADAQQLNDNTKAQIATATAELDNLKSSADQSAQALQAKIDAINVQLANAQKIMLSLQTLVAQSAK